MAAPKATEIIGHLNAQGKRFAIVVSRWNSFITERLLEGAEDALLRHGAEAGSWTIVRVPGSYEMPLACMKLAGSGRYDGIIAIGCVIRGATPHFDYVAAEVSKGVAVSSWNTGVPVSFGVLTTDTIEQAVERAGTKAGNKGWEAATAVIEMADLLTRMDED